MPTEVIASETPRAGLAEPASADVSSFAPTSPVAPTSRSADEVRAWIVNELAGAMKVEPSSLDTAAPLDSLGVDSLAALGMTGGLAGWLGRDLPATLMWDYPSIDAMAEGLADKAPPKPALPPGVIEFHDAAAEGAAAGTLPVFFLPGVGGHPVSFVPLAARLGPARPCYGLTVPGINGDRPLLTSVEAIAAEMLATLRRVQPAGPYQLAGYSFGGLLAYEIARQLTAAGEAVSLLAIYDAFTPAGRVPKPRWQRCLLHAYLLACRPGRLEHLRGLIARRKGKRRRSGSQPDAARPNRVGPSDTIAPTPAEEADEAIARQGDGGYERFREVARVNLAASDRYRPGPFPGRVVLFRPKYRKPYEIFYRVDPTNGWGSLASGAVEVVDLPGGHLRMLDEQNAPAAAEVLRTRLAAATGNA